MKNELKAQKPQDVITVTDFNNVNLLSWKIDAYVKYSGACYEYSNVEPTYKGHQTFIDYIGIGRNDPFLD